MADRNYTTLPMKVLHVIGSLAKGGGAEEVLYNLILNNANNTHIIVSLQELDTDSNRFTALGVSVIGLGMNKSALDIVGFFKLIKYIRHSKPDVVQSWMYYSDILAALASRLVGVKNVVWGIHNGAIDSSRDARTTRIFSYLGSRLSYLLPRRIISCSERGASIHMELGYCAKKMVVVHNGYDLNVFHGLTSATSVEQLSSAAEPVASLRQQYGIGSKTICLGIVARFDPQKDHYTLIKALSLFKEKTRVEWVCFFFGSGSSSDNEQLVDWIKQAEIERNCILFGLSRTINKHIRELDINVMSSRSEAFPNVLNEAMASEVPCVSTDVGDARIIVGDHGWIVPVSDPASLSDALEQAVDEMLRQPAYWNQRRKACRAHILANFSLQTMCENYEAVWRS